MKRMLVCLTLFSFLFLSLAAFASADRKRLMEFDDNGVWTYDETAGGGICLRRYFSGTGEHGGEPMEVLRVPYYFRGNVLDGIESGCFSDFRGGSPRVLILPDKAMYIAPGAIQFSGLEEIQVAKYYKSDDNHYETTDGVLFFYNEHILAVYPRGKKDRSYTVPEGTIAIREKSFENAVYLEEVHVADSVRTIDQGAFNTSHLTVYLPEKIETICPGAILRAGRIISESSRYQVIDDMLIDTQEKTLLAVAEGSADFLSGGSRILTVPEGVETIGSNALMYVSRDQIIFPSTLKKIEGKNTLSVSSGILVFPEGLESIGYSFDAENVQTVVFPSSLRSIGGKCFTSGGIHAFVLPETAAEEYCRENGIAYTYSVFGQWRTEDEEAQRVLSLPDADSIQIRLTTDLLELTYTLNGMKHLESFPIRWSGERLNMEDGYMNITVKDMNQLILEMNGAQLHLTRMEAAE